MKTPFKLKSGNASAFKNLGSSPAKDTDPHTGLKPPHTEENHPKQKMGLKQTKGKSIKKSEESKRKTPGQPFSGLKIVDGKYMYGKVELTESEYKNALRLNKEAGW